MGSLVGLSAPIPTDAPETMYFLNTKHLKLVVHDDVDWMETPSGKMRRELAFQMHPELFTYSTGGRKLGILKDVDDS